MCASIVGACVCVVNSGVSGVSGLCVHVGCTCMCQFHGCMCCCLCACENRNTHYIVLHEHILHEYCNASTLQLHSGTHSHDSDRYGFGSIHSKHKVKGVIVVLHQGRVNSLLRGGRGGERGREGGEREGRREGWNGEEGREKGKV